MAKKQDHNGTSFGFEKEIFAAADKLRKNVDAALYKHIVLGLVFLKYVGDKFEKRHSELTTTLEDPHLGTIAELCSEEP